MRNKAKLQAAIVGGSADDTEAAFYAALQQGDIDKLMDCWADEDEVVCVHPGGPRVVGLLAIRAAFEAMFNHGAIRASPERVRKIESMASSVHNVLEKIEIMTQDGLQAMYVLATNVYHKTAQGWRLVAHHASPGSGQEMLEQSDTPIVLH
jgi:ketosteroid isomerase-like protein